MNPGPGTPPLFHPRGLEHHPCSTPRSWNTTPVPPQGPRTPPLFRPGGLEHHPCSMPGAWNTTPAPPEGLGTPPPLFHPRGLEHHPCSTSGAWNTTNRHTVPFLLSCRKDPDQQQSQLFFFFRLVQVRVPRAKSNPRARVIVHEFPFAHMDADLRQLRYSLPGDTFGFYYTRHACTLTTHSGGVLVA